MTEDKDWPIEFSERYAISGECSLEPGGVVEFSDGKMGDLKPGRAYLVPVLPDKKCEVCGQPCEELHPTQGGQVCNECLEGDS